MKGKTKELIVQQVLRHYFCNVCEEGWPENPLEFLKKYDNGDRDWDDGIINNVAVGFDEGDEEYRRMEVWAPFISNGYLHRLVSESISESISMVDMILAIEMNTEEP